MSFSAIRGLIDRDNRRDHLWRILLDGLNLEEAEEYLSEFRIGLLTFPFRDEEPFGTTSIYRMTEGMKDKDVSNALWPEQKGGDGRLCPDFRSVGSVKDFLDDYFGFTQKYPANFRELKKKYRGAFSYDYLPVDKIDDVATCMVWAARIILEKRSSGIFENKTTIMGLIFERNLIYIRKFDPMNTMPHILDSYF